MFLLFALIFNRDEIIKICVMLKAEKEHCGSFQSQNRTIRWEGNNFKTL